MPEVALHGAAIAAQWIALPVLCGAVLALWRVRGRYRLLEARFMAMRAVQGDLLAIRLVAEDIVDRGEASAAHAATLRLLLGRISAGELAIHDARIMATDRRPPPPRIRAPRPGASRA